ncbi:PH domain-containing protein [Pseudonocardia abyssalis]|uniref:PH domain-containing protein n=1 Tax=Pseudonocardia abyssalis TaxID=2792008 RepID=A0ABS6UVC0_9PSEU|nr:PH domain-containing protein [Pseudonocardia abyssalis]MBW0115775.1 PH domain-containing protein [Pseudonocardia abyssalis]MBW0136191.1 PH domain-containing protein [Pseudonocardia abyssalis]
MTVTGAPPVTDWRRLDRRSIWVEAVKPGGGLLLAGAVAVTFRGWDRVGWIEPTIGAVVVVGILVLSAWAWATTTYRVTATHVELRSGLLVRSARSVPRDRLRSVDLTVDVVHRVAGLAVVAIGTGRQGGESDDELKLESVSTAEAERLRSVLLVREAAPVGAPADHRAPLAEFGASWVRLAPLSLAGLVAIGVLAAALGQFRDAIDYEALWGSGPVRSAVAWAGGVAPPLLALLVIGGLLLLNTVLSTVLYVVSYGGFRLVRDDDRTLRLTYGLLTQRSVTIEEARIRGVRVDEPLLLRLGGGAKAKIVAAGLGVQDSEGNEKRDSDLLLPAVPVALAHRVTADVLGAASSPAAVALRRHPAAALRVLLLRWVPVSLLPAVGLAVPALLGVFPHWPWQLALALVPPAVAGAVLEFGNLGHALSGAFLVARSGSGVRRTAVVRRDGVIAWRFRRTVLQRRPRLLSVTAAVAAGKGAHTIAYADQDEVLRVAADAVPGLLAPFLEPDPAQA